MDKRDVMIIAKKYANEVEKLFHPSAIVLYGSHAKGTARDESDIDIAVVFSAFKGDFLETSKKLWNLTWDIDDRIEPILLDCTNDNSGFVNEVFKTGQVL